MCFDEELEEWWVIMHWYKKEMQIKVRLATYREVASIISVAIPKWTKHFQISEMYY